MILHITGICWSYWALDC